jgi:hypothetical protein
VGAHRVSITKALKKLQDAGKVRSKGKYLFVTNIEAIAESLTVRRTVG